MANEQAGTAYERLMETIDDLQNVYPSWTIEVDPVLGEDLFDIVCSRDEAPRLPPGQPDFDADENERFGQALHERLEVCGFVEIRPPGSDIHHFSIRVAPASQ
jgi:hypothetical protein